MPNTLDDKQLEVQKFWDGKPCDSELSQLATDSRAYYEAIDRERYSFQGHILEFLDKMDWHGKRVLEIGTGVATDARRLIQRGAQYWGINVDNGSCAMTRQALELFGVDGEVQQMSATEMRFADASFDVVYTFGVLHHIPDVQKATAEIYRVLKPGGALLFMVYNRSSINYQIEIRFLRKLGLRLLMLPGVVPLLGRLGLPVKKLQRHVDLFRSFGRISDSEWLSRNTDGPDNPYTVVYDKNEIEHLVSAQFRVLSNEVRYFEPRHWGIAGRILPTSLVRILGTRWGWHRLVHAVKI
jgi:ubiquinone/menaquinone biosynthesis C-methylase UbiE